jgi:hypothetical protein
MDNVQMSKNAQALRYPMLMSGEGSRSREVVGGHDSRKRWVAVASDHREREILSC